MKHYFVAALALFFALHIGLAADVAQSAQTQDEQLNPTEVLNKPDVVEKNSTRWIILCLSCLQIN